MDVHFSDFLSQCEILDVAETTDLSESTYDVTEHFVCQINILTIVCNNTEIWTGVTIYNDWGMVIRLYNEIDVFFCNSQIV